MPFARGKYAKAISDRSGMEFPYREMVREWNGMLVHKSEFEAKHPQLEPRAYGAEGHGLSDARPARAETDALAILGPNPFETISASSGIINVMKKVMEEILMTRLDLEVLCGRVLILMVFKIQ